MPLPPAPPVIDDGSGAPRFGTFSGGVDAVNLDSLKGLYRPGRLERLRMHKKWLYGFVATPEVIALFAVVDAGYASNAFALAVDVSSKKVLVDKTLLGPPRPLVRVNDHPGPGLDVALRLPHARFEARRPFGDERYHLGVRLGIKVPLFPLALDLDADLLAAGAAPALTVVAPVDGGIVNVTQKWAGLLTLGHVSVAGHRYSLDGGVGGLDYTNGFLARRTAWRWAFVCGRLDDGTPLGLNLVEGFNESRDDVNENALWLGTSLYPLRRARFTFKKTDVLDRWHVRTTDDAVDLTFSPIAVHREDRDLKLVKSHFAQPVGLWSGTIRVGDRTLTVKDLPGVAEDQDVLW